MKTIGIIANFTAGKDIRRLTAHGMTISDQQKRNSIVCMLKAMDQLGIDRVEIMPDRTNAANRIVRDYQGQMNRLQISSLDMPAIIGTQRDSILAAKLMVNRGFCTVIVMGGDGTHRVVSKSIGNVPMVAVSSGTNNAFPEMVEGTLVGMAVAALQAGVVSLAEGCRRAPKLELLDEHEHVKDIALVDLAVVDAQDTAARAVWEAKSIKELYLAKASSGSIGLSAIGAQLAPLPAGCGRGMQLLLGGETHTVCAPIAPGILSELGVSSFRQFTSDEKLPIRFKPGVIALDGEREVVLREDDKYWVRINRNGPLVVDIQRTIELAAQRRFLANNNHFASASAAVTKTA